MAITMYSCFDAGAPSPPNTANVGSNAHWNLFKAAMLGCLVTGYGSKPAAGWIEKHNDADCFAIAPADDSFVICFTNHGGYGYHFFTADAISTYPTPGTAGVPVGVNVRSYLWSPDVDPTGSSVGQFAYPNGSMYYWTWCIVADEDTFVLSSGGSYFDPWTWTNGATTGGWAGADTQNLTGGRFKSITGLTGLSNAFCAGGRPTGAAGRGLAAPYNTDTRYSYRISSILRNPVSGLVPGTGQATIIEPLPWMQMPTDLVAMPVIPEVASVELPLTQIPLTYVGTQVGYMRGLAFPLTGMCGNYSGVMVKALGLDVAFPFADNGYANWFHRPVTMADGYEYAIQYNKGWAGLLTNNPAYWGL